MASGPTDSLETLSPTELVGLVRRLVGEVERLRKENEKLTAALASAKRETQELKDEIRRLKGLPPRPPMKPSGMETATDHPAPETPSAPEASPPRRRGPGVSKLSIDRTVTLRASAPAGSRSKGYEEIIVQDIAFKPEVTLYRRERWATPDGRTVTADLPAGVVGGCGPNLHRLVLTLHFQGQMTWERIVAVLTAAGVAISKRQVVRLLTAKLDLFRAEEEAVFTAGLRASGYVSVDDTGARHAGKACYTTQFGSDRFTVFRTGPSKSRLAFLGNLLGGAARYAINAAAAAYMRAANLAHGVIDALMSADVLEFGSEAEWIAHLAAVGVTVLRVTPDPVRVASEAALWGAIAAEDRLGGAVILSDDAGQFHVGDHALCWVHAERLVYKLVPANDRQRNAVEVTRRMIWWFYRQLKAFKLDPSPERAVELRARFDRIFKRRTGYATLDRLLKRLHANKDELLRVLDRPEIPPNTNVSENDIRVCVTKRKVSGGTVSQNGRIARDVMLGLAKTCAKLKISFFHYLGARLGIAGPPLPPLPSLIDPAPS
ncbi:MAG TPA: transposase [Roseiarcus sp.]|nr:transposase [Roseiarcus sp.]